jgi:hypothetical protein
MINVKKSQVTCKYHTNSDLIHYLFVYKYTRTTGVAIDQTMALIVSPQSAHQWYGSNWMASVVQYLYSSTCGVDGVTCWWVVMFLGVRALWDTAGPISG